MSKDNKTHKQAAETFAAATSDLLTPKIEDLQQTLADMALDLKTVITRLEYVSTSVQGGKKPSKTEKKTGKRGKSSETDEKEDPRDKIINCLLYFRWKFATNEEFRDEIMEDERAQNAVSEGNFKSKSGEELYKAQAAAIWKQMKDRHKEFRTEFEEWSRDRKAQNSKESANEEGDAEEGETENTDEAPVEEDADDAEETNKDDDAEDAEDAGEDGENGEDGDDEEKPSKPKKPAAKKSAAKKAPAKKASAKKAPAKKAPAKKAPAKKAGKKK